MKNKHVGILILGMALLMFFIVMSFNMALEEIVNVSCTHGIACPMHSTLETQKAISYGLMSLLFLVGAFIFFFMKGQCLPNHSHVWYVCHLPLHGISSPKAAHGCCRESQDK